MSLRIEKSKLMVILEELHKVESDKVEDSTDVLLSLKKVVMINGMIVAHDIDKPTWIKMCSLGWPLHYNTRRQGQRICYNPFSV